MDFLEQIQFVLVLGSSHAFEDFNTGTLWDEYGMASYVLGGSMQPLWNSYYYLKEALKTQTSELVILEGYLVTGDSEFLDGLIKNTYGLKWSLDKIAAIKASAPEEKWGEFLLEYAQYHARYTDLEIEDFKKNQGNRLFDDWKGFGCNMRTTSLEYVDMSSVIEKTEVFYKTELYYRKIIVLAQNNNIPIAIVISPYAGINEYAQQKFNLVRDIAAEYDVSFLNCNLLVEEIGLDYSTDVSDEAHLNYRGNQKFSRYIGKYLKETFEISDRRGDDRYDTWQRNADFIRQMIKDQILIKMYDKNRILQLIQDPNYWIVISVDGFCNTSDENLNSFYELFGIWDKSLNGVWIKRNNEVEGCFGLEEKKFIRTSAHDFGLTRSFGEEGRYFNAIIFDNEQCQKVNSGINVLVYDTLTEKVADIFGVDAGNNYSVVR